MSLVELPNGSKLYVESRGLPTGRAVVFVGGLGADRRVWYPLLDVKPNELESKFRIILYDWAGSGLSPIVNAPPSIESHAKDLALLVEHLNLESPYIVGHSVGSFIGAKYAVGNQKSISKLVLIGSPLSPAPAEVRTAQKQMAAVIKQVQSLEPIVERSVHAVVGPSSTNALALAYARVLLRAQPLEEYAANLEEAAKFEEHIEVEKLEIPVLVINGSRDQMAGDGSALSQAIRGSKREVIADIGHSVPIEAPDAVAKHLLAFL